MIADFTSFVDKRSFGHFRHAIGTIGSRIAGILPLVKIQRMMIFSSMCWDGWPTAINSVFLINKLKKTLLITYLTCYSDPERILASETSG